jgi:hypothetical protein
MKAQKIPYFLKTKNKKMHLKSKIHIESARSAYDFIKLKKYFLLPL